MKALTWAIAAALCTSASVAGCSKSNDSGGSAGLVGLSASKTSVLANGINSVTLTVSDSAGGPVTLTTSRGTFPGGTQTATVPGAAGTVDLTTCDAAASATCAGAAVITAQSASGGFASISITFGTLLAACAADCAADPGCAGLACTGAGGATGACSSTSPSACVIPPACTPNPAGATTETSCSDGIDNDCNGDVDCADAACGDQACMAGSPTFACRSGVCTDTTSGLALQVTPARTRLPANGTTATAVVVSVTGDGAPLGGIAVDLATNLGTLSAASATTGPDGTATFTLTASATPGVATLTAHVTAVPTVSATATVTIPRLGSFHLPENPGPVQYPVQGVVGSGWREFGFVQVQVLDEAGDPYPDGLVVRFEHRRLGGSTLGAPLAADTAACVAASGCVAVERAVTSGDAPPDSAGLASAWLYSGTVGGTLVLTATTTAGGVTRSITLPTVAVVGARASGTNFAITCSPRDVPALAETDCAVSLVEDQFTCAAILKDRFNNLLGTATQVVFLSEAGAVGHVATTPAYDPESDPASQADLGVATQIFNTLGAGLPFDVAPAAGEPSASHGLDGCGTRTHNPRDGVLTVVAIADGEEGFFDTNGNGVYDLGEPFVDQGEPFVDQDDDGVYSLGEPFLDVDGSGGYTARNGVWDANAKLWTQTVVVYTGEPATIAVPGPAFLGTRWAGAPFAGACTASADPAPFGVAPGQTGPPEVAPTSQQYFVVAADQNLNRLDAASTYDVAVKAGTITADYEGLPSYADDLGFFFRYWPCDQTGACASQCRASGAALPCVMTPALTGFGCGIAAPVIITGGSAPDAGDDLVDWNVSTPYAVYGSARTALVTRRLSGTSK